MPNLFYLCRYLLSGISVLLSTFVAAGSELALDRIPGATPRNIVFILVDDLRHDVLGCTGHPFTETPNIDSLAKRGVLVKNAFVTTSLCSPSRATILTGLYVHRHHVVDNNNPVPPGTTFFSQYLQKAGYQTAFVGKWHMGGEADDPQPGFDHWVSFRGQGSYLPVPSGLNVNGKRVPQKGYITDEITDYAMEWLNSVDAEKPFLLYLSHKACHSEFIPAERHQGRYQDKPMPPLAADTPEDFADKPMWVKNQRNSWHGVEFAYHSSLDVEDYYKRYCETLLAVDDSVGRVLDLLRDKGLLDSTLVIFMGDNGFLFGEHGLIDKRNAYEESIRVPLVMQCPDLFKGGRVVNQMVANLDIAPTILEAAGLVAPNNLDGKSFLPLAQGNDVPWRDTLLYEYYWERNFPQTPAMHALRTDQYKYIHYYGLWDTDELYDLENDPKETKNLVRDSDHQQIVNKLNGQLFATLKSTDGMYIPLQADRGGVNNLRRADASPAADFPSWMLRDAPPSNDVERDTKSQKANTRPIGKRSRSKDSPVPSP
jgi:N-acetylglucosamine-6-sulfatase